MTSYQIYTPYIVRLYTTIARKFEQFKNETSFKLWITDSTDDSPDPIEKRVDLQHPVRSFLKLGEFLNTSEEILETLNKVYQYVLIIQMELEF